MARFISREPLVSIADLTLFIYEELAVNVHYMECFGSFAPIRGLTEDGSQAQWFVDGQATFEAIATSIQDAKSEVLRSTFLENHLKAECSFGVLNFF